MTRTALLAAALLLGAACTTSDKDDADDTQPAATDDSAPAGDDTEPQADDSGGATETWAIPVDVDVSLPATDISTAQATFEAYAWQTLLGMNADGEGALSADAPQWAGWSTTVDLIQCNNDPTGCCAAGSDTSCEACAAGECAAGVRYYPPTCITDATGLPEGVSYWDYRVLDQVGKVDDFVLEAGEPDGGGGPQSVAGLSTDPVLDVNEGFLRYSISLNPQEFEWVRQEGLYDKATLDGMLASETNVTFGCGDVDSGTVGPITAKAAWMEAPDCDPATMYCESLLVYTPGYRNSDGEPTCALQQMALVGMHVVRKIPNQPAWTWSTFEHATTAPECSTGIASKGVNTEHCPSDGEDFLLFDKDCGEICAPCNTTPAPNGGDDSCWNPEVDTDTGLQAKDNWCVDKGAATGGRSQLCRQVKAEDDYAEAVAENSAVHSALPEGSPWRHYELIATQWFNVDEGSDCPDVADDVTDLSGSGSATRDTIYPQVTFSDDDSKQKPVLGNTTMESYERSNCMGCHSKSIWPHDADPSETDDYIRLDFSYWMGIEVAAYEAAR